VTDSGLVGSDGRSATRAEDAQGTPTQSHISPSMLVYEENALPGFGVYSTGEGLAGSESCLNMWNTKCEAVPRRARI